jgi:hypothetical protein
MDILSYTLNYFNNMLSLVILLILFYIGKLFLFIDGNNLVGPYQRIIFKSKGSEKCYERTIHTKKL